MIFKGLSIYNREVGELAAGRFFSEFKAIHAGGRGSPPAPVQHPLGCLLFPFENRLNAAIRKIADPARQPQSAGGLPGVGPEENPLHTASDMDVEPFFQWLSLPINVKNASSSRMAMPSFLALSNLDPAASPATTYLVVFVTEWSTFPPRDSTRALASFRPIRPSVPVNTKDLPLRGACFRRTVSPRGDSRSAEFIQDFEVCRFPEEAGDAGGDPWADVPDGLQLLRRGRCQGFKGVEGGGKTLRSLLADLPDSQGEDQAVERGFLGPVDCGKEV